MMALTMPKILPLHQSRRKTSKDRSLASGKIRGPKRQELFTNPKLSLSTMTTISMSIKIGENLQIRTTSTPISLQSMSKPTSRSVNLMSRAKTMLAEAIKLARM